MFYHNLSKKIMIIHMIPFKTFFKSFLCKKKKSFSHHPYKEVHFGGINEYNTKLVSTVTCVLLEYFQFLSVSQLSLWKLSFIINTSSLLAFLTKVVLQSPPNNLEVTSICFVMWWNRLKFFCFTGQCRTTINNATLSYKCKGTEAYNADNNKSKFTLQTY